MVGLAPKVNARIEDQGTASRLVHVRTVSEGERQKALETRQSALKKTGEHVQYLAHNSRLIAALDVSLGSIARSSAAVSGSPPTSVSRVRSGSVDRR